MKIVYYLFCINIETNSLSRLRESVGIKVVKALKRENDGVTHAAIDMICALMHPMHDDYDLRQEQMNKSSLLSSQSFVEKLLDMWIHHVVSWEFSGSLLLHIKCSHDKKQ